jgi:hypothetical protein
VRACMHPWCVSAKGARVERPLAGEPEWGEGRGEREGVPGVDLAGKGEDGARGEGARGGRGGDWGKARSSARARARAGEGEGEGEGRVKGRASAFGVRRSAFGVRGTGMKDSG